MPKGTQTIERRLAEAQIAITNVRASAELQAALAAYGYTPDRIRQGEQLHDAARAQCQQKITAYGGLRTAADALTDIERQAQKEYMRHVKIARVALETDRGALQALQILGRRKQSLSGWLAQAQQFYSAALADSNIQHRLGDYGIGGDILRNGARQIEAVAARQAARHQQRGAALNATSVRDAALTDLEQWMRDFKTVARVALKERPRLLEQIGLQVQS